MHDAGAALIKNGRVIAAVQEERLRNIKHYAGVPEQAIKEVFNLSKIHPSEVSAIAVATLCGGLAPTDEEALSEKIIEKTSPLIASHSLSKLYVRIFHRFRNIKALLSVLQKIGVENKEVFFVEHHLAHASCAYYSSPYSENERVLVFTADGTGDGVSSTVSIADKSEISRLGWSTYYDSLGNTFYTEITAYLGLKRWDHEYKVMGLAPYGRAEACLEQMKKIIRLNPKNPMEFQNTINATGTSVQEKLRKLLAGRRFDDIAASAQYWLELLLLEWIKNCLDRTGIDKIACSGGVFLNVKANKLIRESLGLSEAFFYPAAGDDGLPVGAALHVYNELCKREGTKPEKVPLADLYYGSQFDDEQILTVLKDEGLSDNAEEYSDIEGVVGNLLSKGEIVARFNGRMEWGPRALGNRSILADARDLKAIRKINFAIKHRDFWMPFAPSVLNERLSEYLIKACEAPYMIMAFDTTEKRDELIAGIHPFDLTCRPQTLNTEWNPSYRRILESFEENTGVGGVLNTSFNLHGYPIVATPKQAVYTFKNSAIDSLAIGHYLVRR